LYLIYKNKTNMERQKKITISVSINRELFDILNIVTSNRSGYLDRALLEYFNKLGIDTSKIKL
jgi:hypothetical protein